MIRMVTENGPIEVDETDKSRISLLILDGAIPTDTESLRTLITRIMSDNEAIRDVAEQIYKKEFAELLADKVDAAKREEELRSEVKEMRAEISRVVEEKSNAISTLQESNLVLKQRLNARLNASLDWRKKAEKELENYRSNRDELKKYATGLEETVKRLKRPVPPKEKRIGSVDRGSLIFK